MISRFFQPMLDACRRLAPPTLHRRRGRKDAGRRDSRFLEPLEELPAELSLLGLRSMLLIEHVLEADPLHAGDRDPVHRMAVRLTLDRLTLSPSDAKRLIKLNQIIENALIPAGPLCP